MSGPDASTPRRLHRLLEHYTPDGLLGRVLLGLPMLALAPVLFIGGFAMLGGPTSLLVFLMGLLFLLASPFSLLLGVVCLWPVYLSLIGNVESPDAYPEQERSFDVRREAAENAEATLKRRYAKGEISREEFEKRLDALFDADDRRPGPDRREGSRTRRRETESSR
ncbi:SHOCT domain-containing protein [Halorarum halobium]|uniref:SHOCT domain-containing protein n=1 Tax=Halorarum halobium TaxID=3075121 RepID=UPI0028AA20F8|nr:SHOCT domain-containing protein [Halobaculum sp. XH14]